MKSLLTFILLATVHTAPAQIPLAHQTLDVVYIGDSITMGATLHNRETEAPPTLATQYLQSHLPGISVNMENVGRNGRTTVDFLPTKKDFLSVEDAAKSITEAHPGTLVFSIMLGTNDSANRGTTGSPVAPPQYAANLTAIITQLLHDYPQAIFILNRPTWYSPNTENGADYSATGLRRLESYTPQLANVVQAFATTNPGHVLSGDSAAFDAFTNKTENYTPEPGKQGTFYLHPNATGAHALGEFWAEAILHVLKP